MSDELKLCELEETERFVIRYDNQGIRPEVLHVLECSECGRTSEHVYGDYERCPHCGAVNVLHEDYEQPQVIKNAESYKLADDSRPQVIAASEKHELADSRERLEADVRGICWGHAFYRYDAQKRYLDERGLDVREDIVTTNYDGHVLATVIMHLLDRQAAITSSEWCYSHDALEEELERVRAERDDLLRITKELEERNGGLLEGRAHWIDQAVSIYRRFYPHNAYAVPDDVSSMVLAKIAELEAERDELRDFAAEKIAELAEKQHVIDVQRESFRKMERDCADMSKALVKACAELADRIGSCPYDIYDVQPVDCADKCTGEPAGCWRLYFEGVRHGEGRSEG